MRRPLIQLSPGTRFQLAELDLTGTLLAVSESRARVRLERPLELVEFEGPDGEAKEPLTTKAMIDAMGAKGYWSSPGGQTPAATLYSALIREIAKKGKEARFVKTDRGQFALNK